MPHKSNAEFPTAGLDVSGSLGASSTEDRPSRLDLLFKTFRLGGGGVCRT